MPESDPDAWDQDSGEIVTVTIALDDSTVERAYDSLQENIRPSRRRRLRKDRRREWPRTRSRTLRNRMPWVASEAISSRDCPHDCPLRRAETALLVPAGLQNRRGTAPRTRPER